MKKYVSEDDAIMEVFTTVLTTLTRPHHNFKPKTQNVCKQDTTTYTYFHYRLNNYFLTTQDKQNCFTTTK